MSFFSKLLKVISHKKYQKNPLGKKLSPLQQSVLNIGAVNAEQTMFYCDSLETGSEKEEIRNNLAAYYDIIDEESALHTLEWLLERGHRVYFDAIKLFSAGISPSITDEILTPDEQLDTPRYYEEYKGDDRIPDRKRIYQFPGGFTESICSCVGHGAAGADRALLL